MMRLFTLFLTTLLSTLLLLAGEKKDHVTLIDGTKEMSPAAVKTTDTSYPPLHLFDNNPATCWVAGKTGSTEPLELHLLVPEYADTLFITPGHGKSLTLFRKNAAPRIAAVTIMDAVLPSGHVTELAARYRILRRNETVLTTLHDKPLPAAISLPDMPKTTSSKYGEKNHSRIVHIKFDSIRPGKKSRDICISEMFFSVKIELSKPLTPKGKKLQISSSGHTLLRKQQNGKTQPVLQLPGEILQIVATTSDNRIVLLIRMPSKIQGRVATRYMIVDTRNNRNITPVLKKAWPGWNDSIPVTLSCEDSYCFFRTELHGRAVYSHFHVSQTSGYTP